MASKEEDLISYKGHSDARLERSSGIPVMGVVDLQLCPGFLYFCTFLCVLFLLCVGGFPCRSPD